MAMAMVMATATIMIIQMMIDIRNHLLYGVDDGSENLDMTIKLFEEYKKQGIKTAFLTPHVNSSVSKESREVHIEKFNQLKPIAKKYNIDIHLGAEIYIPFRMPKLCFNEYVMGNSKVLLVEFSIFQEAPINDHVHNLISKGFDVIIAHVERYNYLTIDDLLELREIGAYTQINASSILKKSLYRKKVIQLIKKDFIDFVSTDTHNISFRSPKLRDAFIELKRLFGENKALDLVCNNQKKLFFNT